MQRLLACPFFRRAFGWSVPIGSLGGLIGLGGGEFRLPVLMHVVGFDAKSAVPLNLIISLVTLSFALLARGRTIRNALTAACASTGQRLLRNPMTSPIAAPAPLAAMPERRSAHR